MKLIGIPWLGTLAKDNRLSGEAAALHAELRAGGWRSAEEFVADYPLAIIDGTRALIIIGHGNCVVLHMRYDAGMILIEFAGTTNAWAQTRKAGRRAA